MSNSLKKNNNSFHDFEENDLYKESEVQNEKLSLVENFEKRDRLYEREKALKQNQKISKN